MAAFHHGECHIQQHVKENRIFPETIVLPGSNGENDAVICRKGKAWPAMGKTLH